MRHRPSHRLGLHTALLELPETADALTTCVIVALDLDKVVTPMEVIIANLRARPAIQ